MTELWIFKKNLSCINTMINYVFTMYDRSSIITLYVYDSILYHFNLI